MVGVITATSFVLPKHRITNDELVHSYNQHVKEAAGDNPKKVFSDSEFIYKASGIGSSLLSELMTKNIDVEKVTPQQIAVEICNGIESDILDIFPDTMSRELSEKIGHQCHIFSKFNS